MKLSVSGIDFSYRSTPILDDVSFGVEPGELLCILGVNGAGKSTLIKCINRILAPQRGTVLVDGKAVFDMRQREVAHRRQKQRRARFARPHMGRFPGHLGHPYRVNSRIKIIERGRFQVELVAQHDDQCSQGSHRQLLDCGK